MSVPGAELDAEIEVSFRHIKAIKCGQKDSALIMESRRERQVTAGPHSTTFRPKSYLFVEACISHERVEFFALGVSVAAF